MNTASRIARWPVLNFSVELAGVVVLLGAGAVIASSVRNALDKLRAQGRAERIGLAASTQANRARFRLLEDAA